MVVDAFIALVREFGWWVAGSVFVVVGLVSAIRILAVRLEKAYQDQIASLKEAHVENVKNIREGCAREIAEVRLLSERGWTMAEQFRLQAERLAERYAETAPILRDLANATYDRRGRAGGK